MRAFSEKERCAFFIVLTSENTNTIAGVKAECQRVIAQDQSTELTRRSLINAMTVT